MIGNKNLKKTYATMLIIGIPMDIIEIGALIYGIVKGVWWPFIISMAVAVIIAYPLVRMYYRNTSYICPECGKKFRPQIRGIYICQTHAENKEAYLHKMRI